MRHALARLVSRDPTAPSLRERLTGARTRLAAVTGRRISTAPALAQSAPAVDRAALVNYATFLHLERERVQAELYPHVGSGARRFVRSLNMAWAFFHTGRDTTRPRPGLAPASARAITILDAVGIDWRADVRMDGRLPEDDERYRDDGTRPALPHDWPTPDAVLLEALDDLRRLDGALAALGKDTDDTVRDLDAVPGYDSLEAARAGALDRLTKEPAESLSGLQAKARAILTPGVQDCMGASDDLAASLARDLLGLGQAAVEPQPDPVFAAIAEIRRLNEAWTAANRLLVPLGSIDPVPEADAAQAAFRRHCEDILLTTVPHTAEGCKALARYAGEHIAREDYALDEDERGRQHLRLLALIARSPLL